MWNGRPAIQVYLMTSWTFSDCPASCTTAPIEKISDSSTMPGDRKLISLREGAKWWWP